MLKYQNESHLIAYLYISSRIFRAVASILVNAEPSPENEDAVTIPEKVAPPYTLKAAPVPTFISMLLLHQK